MVCVPHTSLQCVIYNPSVEMMMKSIPGCFCTDSYAELMEVNHDDEVVDTERFNISQEIEDVTLESMQPAEQEVAKRLTTPIVNTYLDTKDIAFERRVSHHFLTACTHSVSHRRDSVTPQCFIFTLVLISSLTERGYCENTDPIRLIKHLFFTLPPSC